MKRIIDAMIQIEPGALDNQVAIWIPDIRKLAGIPQSEFNRLILEMALASGIIRLKRYPYPAQLTKQEKAEMVFDGEHFYSGVIIRADAAERVVALAAEPVDRIQVEPVAVQANQPDPMPVEQISLAEPVPKKRGGSRPGSGRKTGVRVVNADAERLPLCIRLPRWMLNWLTDRGNAGSTIEAALIEAHGLTPPV